MEKVNRLLTRNIGISYFSCRETSTSYMEADTIYACTAAVGQWKTMLRVIFGEKLMSHFILLILPFELTSFISICHKPEFGRENFSW